ncbi:ZYRO0G13002p [Zygosaccharomyces rouxii]|uniref:ZYRO0G13002p n=1 Tax=Zygosaccharomyces rouxii (strain ATCC 2623 / CBS 732 / NBRC 1130 / NCYC 568 / NRRL Y-229) TaxID=559307 RepID=C5E0I5_ZYGRC|nr:uncharacterized protein ZYRO0G13002g [Zygosaccharomyces rouxii]KAH9202613.1 hypothetical protein LQ764DRAFT_207582 [Zygosaccharomyces rouxii]CAR29619.1 ZYRO0G13002p [Zygosaccharomyces rouxii]
MFLEEWQFFETPFFEPLKGFKDVPLDDGEIDFFNFEDPHIHTHNYFNNNNNNNNNFSNNNDNSNNSNGNNSNRNNVNRNYDEQETNCNNSNGLMEDWWQLPTPDSESGSGYAPLSDSAAGSQATPVDFSLRTSASGVLEPAPVPASSSVSSSFLVTDGFSLDNEQLLEQDQEYGHEEEDEHEDSHEDSNEDLNEDSHVGGTPILTPTPRYVKQPRQNRYSGSSPPKGRRVSDSRLSAQGLAEVLRLDSPDEALKRERFILDIFETELHYPLGYKTWVRDTSKDYRHKLIDQLYDRVRGTYPEYDRNVLETIIRRATYYIMQSRLRRERRAKAKSRRESSSSSN